MDPATAAGIGIGVVSVTFQLFSGCIKSYQLLIDAVDMPKKFLHLQVRLQLEQVRLLKWGERVGLLHDVLEEPSLVLQLHRNLIFEILLRISQLFTECLRLQRKFSTVRNVALSNRQDQSLTGTGLLEGTGTANLFAKATTVLQRTSELPKRLEWAMVRHERFENMVVELVGYNDSILSLLDSADLERLRQDQRQTALTLLQLSTDVDQLKQLAQAVNVQPTNGQTAFLIDQNQARPSLLRAREKVSMKATAQLDMARLAMFKASHIDNDRSWLSVHNAPIESNDIRIVGSTSRMDVAMFHNQQVWIEWKEFDEDNRNPWYKDILELRIRKLEALLRMQDVPTEFRKPLCLGYVREVEDDSVRYGLVNKMPQNVSQAISQPISTTLLDLIKHEQCPSLNQRMKLASLLASSLMHLHAVNWLHKGFRSENILFFHETHDEVAYDQPIISGFEYARPDEPSELTEKPRFVIEHDMYRPPHGVANLTARSQKSWDIYGLGVVLVEISAWQSIDQITNIDLKAPNAKSRVRKIRDFLLQDHVLHKVGASCGDRYRVVVRRCLTGGQCLGTGLDVDESDVKVGSEMIKIFSRDIVDVLQSIRL